MPGLNRTGPQGEGPMTGRKQGKCNPKNRKKTDGGAEDVSPGSGARRGKGRMRGRKDGRGTGRAQRNR